MDKQQAMHLIKSTFDCAFDEQRYARFMGELFNGRIDASNGQVFDHYGQSIPDSFKDYVRRYKRLGRYKDPSGHEIDLLIVTLRHARLLDRARTMQRNFAAYHLQRCRTETAIIAYMIESHADWRFSMVRHESLVTFNKLGKLVTDKALTPIRRYSFLVGQHERSHTAQQQLFPILLDDKHDPTLRDLEAAFNIETVTKEFFERYQRLFLALKGELDSLTMTDSCVQTEFSAREVDTANFAKKLLGQIVFLYFLQKKGWLGVRDGQPWGSGPRDFMRQLFDRKWIAYDNFFNDILEPLFYEALAIERPDTIFPRLNARIPFLNGGLFEPMNNYDWQTTDILIDNHVFKDIFDTFDLYNFTVREDKPLEKEIAVDPEMLGKVFEKLLDATDRKSKGAFYTPREIVHYMCQESLITYLDTAMGTAVPHDDLAAFIRVGDRAVQHDTAKETGTVSYTYQMPESIRAHARQLDDALAQIKICDPAIGSGAFPVGMMHEIVNAREVLTTYLEASDTRTPYHFKRHATQESIYGVDIDPSAIDIAKLRLWLSLVVDEDDYHHIKPLPNLDYKIMCGNSLSRVQKDLFNLELFQDLETLKTRYFNETNSVMKHAQRSEIDTLITQLTGEHRQFDIHVYFSEVFHNGGGFDVVLGNPPYVRGDKLGDLKGDLRNTPLYADVYSGTADVYVYFYRSSFDILKPHGSLAFITSNKFVKAKYGKNLRMYLATHADIHQMIDFGELPVFKEAATFPFILIASKTPAQTPPRFTQVTTWNGNESVHRLVQNNGEILSRAAITGADWLLTDRATAKVLHKVSQAGLSLGEYVSGRIYYGIKTGFNTAFVIDDTKRAELITRDAKSAEIIKPYAVGDDVRKWRIHQNKWLIVTQSNVDIERYPAIFAHLSQWQKELEKRSDKGNYWWELRACSYYTVFEEVKIMYPVVAKTARFTLDSHKTYSNDKTFIVGVSSLYLLGVLNSSTVWEYLKNTCSVLGDPHKGGRLELRGIYIETVPIPEAPADIRQQIELLTQQCLTVANDAPEHLSSLEAQINRLVYQAYQLDNEDMALIERRGDLT